MKRRAPSKSESEVSILVDEAYKTLRSNIQFSSYGKKLKVISITSANPSEGKTTTALNVAISFAQIGKKVLLIDADMRRPRQHHQMHVRGERGLSTLLSGQDSADEIIQKVPAGAFEIDVISAGLVPPNPSEMLSASIFKEYIDVFREVYDLIVIDTPPVLLVTDAQIVTQVADATVFVLDKSKTKRAQLVDAKNRLSLAQANIIGVVLNNVELGKESYSNYHS